MLRKAWRMRKRVLQRNLENIVNQKSISRLFKNKYMRKYLTRILNKLSTHRLLNTHKKKNPHSHSPKIFSPYQMLTSGK